MCSLNDVVHSASEVVYYLLGQGGRVESVTDSRDIGPDVVQRIGFERYNHRPRTGQFTYSLLDNLEADRAHFALRLSDDVGRFQFFEHRSVYAINAERVLDD